MTTTEMITQIKEFQGKMIPNSAIIYTRVTSIKPGTITIKNNKSEEIIVAKEKILNQAKITAIGDHVVIIQDKNQPEFKFVKDGTIQHCPTTTPVLSLAGDALDISLI